MKNVPVVLAAFGTTSRALDTYSYIDAALRRAFPGHPLRWAYTSRIVRAHMNQRRRTHMRNPHQVLEALAGQGYEWAVVQSMHLICGHEFYRLIEEVRESPLRTSMGLPLLSSPDDYAALSGALLKNGASADHTAHVLVGHGTDHPAWTAYPALQRILRKSGANLHVATVEGEAAMAETINAVIRSGADHVHLVPLMLVAGVHLEEDIAGEEHSWKRAFLDAGLTVSVERHGLGRCAAVVDIFIAHIRDALAVIPDRSASV
jgi:sirohydrochlorin cobaltochelatase